MRSRKLAQLLVDRYGEQGVSVRELIDAQIAKAKENGRTIDRETAFEEVVADSIEVMFTQGDAASFMANLKQKDKTLWEKVRDWFRDLAQKLRSVVEAYKGYGPETAEGRLVAQMEDFIGVLQEAYSEALVDAADSYRASWGNKKTTREGGVKYSVRTTEDGLKYVVLDGNIFVDNDGKVLSPKQAYNALVGQEITLEDGDTITFVRRLAHKEMYKELFKKYPGYDGTFDIVAFNWEINKNIVDVFAGSSIQERNQEQKHYHYGVQDFDQRQVYVTDGNEVFRLELNIANLTDGKKVAYVKRFIERAPTEIREKIMKANEAGKTRQHQPSDTSIRNAEPIVNPESTEKRSDRDPTAAATAQELEKQNEKLKQDVADLRELLRLQGKLTHGTEFRESSIEAAVKGLTQTAGATLDADGRKQLYDMLKGFYKYIASDGELAWEDVREEAGKIADFLQSNVRFKPQRSEYANDVLKYLRGQRVRLSETQRAEVEKLYGYENFRKQLFGAGVYLSKDCINGPGIEFA